MKTKLERVTGEKHSPQLCSLLLVLLTVQNQIYLCQAAGVYSGIGSPEEPKVGRRLQGHRLEAYAKTALFEGVHRPDYPGNRVFADRLLAVLGAKGDRESQVKIATIYKELKLPVPAYLQKALSTSR